MCAEKYTLLIVQYNGEVSVCHKKVTKFWQVGKLFWQVGKLFWQGRWENYFSRLENYFGR